MSPEIRQDQINNPVAEPHSQPGIFEKINNSVRLRLAIAGIAISAAIGANELISHPDKAGASPAVATKSDARGDCIKAALQKPEIEAKMIHPGKLNQHTIVEIGYGAMPVECQSVVKRANSYQVKLQNPKKPKRWFTIQDWFDNGTYISNDEGGFKQVTSTPYEEAWRKYKCTPGKKKTKVYVQARNRAKDANSGKVIGQKIFRHNVRVEGAC